MPPASRKAPPFRAKPADILVRIAPAGKFAIENPGQRDAVQHVIAGAKIVMAKDGVGRRRNMGFEPTDAPFEHRPRRRMAVEIGAKPSDLVRRPNLFMRGEKCEIGARRSDRVNPGELAAEPFSDRWERRVESRIASDPVGCGGPLDPPHGEKRLPHYL